MSSARNFWLKICRKYALVDTMPNVQDSNPICKKRLMFRIAAPLVMIAADDDPAVPSGFWNPDRIGCVGREPVAKRQDLVCLD